MTNADLARLQIEKHGKDRYPTHEEQYIKLTEEVGELGKEINRSLRTVGRDWDRVRIRIGNEAADVALALYNLCAKYSIDLDVEIKSKVENDVRKF